MKKSKMVSIVGYVLIVVGLLVTLWSTPLIGTEKTSTQTIPSGDYFRYWKTGTITAAQVSGSFQVEGGTDVELFIFTEAQYDQWYSTGTGPSLAHAIAPAGKFSQDLPGTGVFYLIVAHGPTSNAEQTFTLTYEASGIMITYLLVGVVLLAIGIVLSVMGLRMKRGENEMEAPPIPPKAVDDVTSFDRTQKLK